MKEKNTIKIIKLWKINYLSSLLLCVLPLLTIVTAQSRAETITIGKGSGVIWEGLPYNVTMTGDMGNAAVEPRYGLLAISLQYSGCMSPGSLTPISGYQARIIAPGVGIIPRATGTANYVRYDKTPETLTGTIGLPQSGGTTTAGAVITNPILTGGSFTWCLPPSMSNNDYFYDFAASRTATLTGTWVIVANGSQTNGEVQLPPMYAGSYSASRSGDRYIQIFPSDVTLRISTLECQVATTTAINFGGVRRNTQPGAEMAVKSFPLSVSCSQPSDMINANINVQFRAISGLYNSTPSRLALTQGGGYITGEIDHGVTGSGACSGTGGIPFDNTQLKVGSISASETSKTTSNNIIWRLCSGGAALPEGAVDASTEMLVTFN